MEVCFSTVEINGIEKVPTKAFSYRYQNRHSFDANHTGNIDAGLFARKHFSRNNKSYSKIISNNFRL